MNAVLEGFVKNNKNGKIPKGSGAAKDWKISDDGVT
ncbi:ABC-type dipeptide/oligopeptide/nickel transport system, periplasmic component [Caldanaerobacter subterraneus subsp. pacificus DSM 12653]|uniref:ABC-type dipeptide/oligopeptide/nickel transport system, periplasmic component n=1 Tax=Caldanaerobacter subterraneus subsp. pacificus DSM 12653 TaxID=391606 RepID=A0A0F5PNR8_9THEO|nr:ABC-type dipeptide/oligopeptide/nickel transport system, periplasmic component [Caldanaerobacter subterraneus subsp. pacificus DSM 12653]